MAASLSTVAVSIAQTIAVMSKENLDIIQTLPILEKELELVTIHISEEKKCLEETTKEIDQLEKEKQTIETETQELKKVIKQTVVGGKLDHTDFLERVRRIAEWSSNNIDNWSALVDEIPVKAITSDVGIQVCFDKPLSELLEMQDEIEFLTHGHKYKVKKNEIVSRIETETFVIKEEEIETFVIKEEEIEPDMDIIEEITPKKYLRIGQRPIWMSPITFTNSNKRVGASTTIKCAGCKSEYKGWGRSAYPELDYFIHCVEECPEYLVKKKLFNCLMCGCKFLDSVELSLHEFVCHSDEVQRPSWMEKSAFKDSYLDFKADGRLPCPGCSLEFEITRKDGQLIPSFYMWKHMVESCPPSHNMRLIRKCANCNCKFIRDMGFNEHVVGRACHKRSTRNVENI